MTMARRLAAISVGAMTYDSGKPCRNNHAAERYASTGGCVQCLAERYGKTKELVSAGRSHEELIYSKPFPAALHPILDKLHAHRNDVTTWEIIASIMENAK
jgi:hypothetical protein